MTTAKANSTDLFAKILASENIRVRRATVSTASFNIENRVLTLPVWEDLTDDVETLFVGHEVAHALYTPQDACFQRYQSMIRDRTGIRVSLRAAKSIANILEDARIERIILQTYPGLRRAFLRGYSNLISRGFFGEMDHLADLSFLDRINVYFKTGLPIPFSKEEADIVDMIRSMDTFDDVRDVGCVLARFLKENQESEDLGQEKSNPSKDDSSETEEDSSETEEDSSETEEDSSETEEDSSETEEVSDDDGDTGETEQAEGSEDDEELDIESSTSDSLNEASESMTAEGNGQEVLDVSEFRASVHPAPFYVIHEDTKTTRFLTKEEVVRVFYHDVPDYTRQGVKDYMETLNPFVQTMEKEFNLRKRAAEHRRTRLAPTGSIDPNRLTQYRWSEDLFKRMSLTDKGKNHGVLLFVDMSTSMTNLAAGTLRQAILAGEFCRRNGIPFRVYGWTSSASGITVHPDAPKDEHHPSRRLSTYLFLDSTWNKATWDAHLTMMLSYFGDVHYNGLRDMGVHHKQFMGVTPTCEAILTSIHIHNEWKTRHTIDNSTIIFWTDGESGHGLHTVRNREGGVTRLDSLSAYWEFLRSETGATLHGAMVGVKKKQTARYVENNFGQSASTEFTKILSETHPSLTNTRTRHRSRSVCAKEILITMNRKTVKDLPLDVVTVMNSISMYVNGEHTKASQSRKNRIEKAEKSSSKTGILKALTLEKESVEVLQNLARTIARTIAV